MTDRTDPSMNPTLSDADRRVERLVTGLPVRRPGPGLDARVAATLAGAGAPRGAGSGGPMPLWRWRPVGSAAAVLLLAAGVGVVTVLLMRDGAPGPGPEVAARPAGVVDEPVTFEQVSVAVEPTGRIVLAGGRAMAAVRVTTLRQVSFEEDGVAFEIATPEEQVVLVPAAYN